MNVLAIVPEMLPFGGPPGPAEHTAELLAALATEHRVIAVTPLRAGVDGCGKSKLPSWPASWLPKP